MPSTFAAVSYGRSLSPEILEQLRTVLADGGARVLSEHRRQDPAFEAYVMDVELDGDAASTGAGDDTALGRVRAALAAAAVDGVDTAVVPAPLRGAERKLIIMDVDSTLIQQEVIELLAAHAGTEALVAEVTAAAMRGELDFAQSLHSRVATLAGLPESVLAEVGAKVKLSLGAERLVREAKAAGHVVAAVSGGFSQILAPLAAELQLDFALANDLEIVDGVLTGKVVGDVVDRAAKATALRRWAGESGIDLAHTIAIGDGANDLDMMAVAALGVAFNAKPAVRAAADAQINLPQLDVALALAGI
ncbi:phosphoserine phosphatase SerB [Arthrobacter sp. 35W]|uniref:phosphoserine phosphatase SerB n=1 Tax=Arthrobacter sp. 35W TaxID=1132441 RepID=UPI00041EA899|nr:phosphoserine phosphatase SerB [Arthrobacter sp. 35W]